MWFVRRRSVVPYRLSSKAQSVLRAFSFQDNRHLPDCSFDGARPQLSHLALQLFQPVQRLARALRGKLSGCQSELSLGQALLAHSIMESIKSLIWGLYSSVLCKRLSTQSITLHNMATIHAALDARVPVKSECGGRSHPGAPRVRASFDP